MRRVRRRRRRGPSEAGFTLIELMVSLVMFSFAIAGVLAVAVAMVNGFREQRLAVTTEAATRSAMDFLGDALRGASPALASGAIMRQDGLGNCVENAFTLTNSETAPDTLEVVFAYGSVVTSTRDELTASGTATLDLTDASQIAAGDTLVISDFAKAHVVNVTGVSGTAVTIDVPCTITGTYAAGSIVVRALNAEFSIADLDGIPTLFMNPDPSDDSAAEPLAEGIEDMQIAIAVDTTTNGIDELGAGANDDEWWHNVAGETLTMPVVGAIRAVRITLVARAVGEVTGVGTFYRPDAEDRSASSTPDNFRRRVLTSIVEVRNLGGSP